MCTIAKLVTVIGGMASVDAAVEPLITIMMVMMVLASFSISVAGIAITGIGTITTILATKA